MTDEGEPPKAGRDPAAPRATAGDHGATVQFAPEEVARVVEEVGAIIDSRDLATVFQPVVHLGTAEVVGFEAFSRGPAGSSLESPVRLLAAAQLAGRLAELDWICATSAYAAAVEANLHPSMTVFLNFHPATLLAPCPTDLLSSARHALDRLRVVVDTKEKELTSDPSRLFEALRLVRDVGWGVAIDDAGASTATLALLPLVLPDVLKLDLRGPRGTLEAIAEAADGARMYGEQTGATILVQGVEEPEDLMVARFVGATYGQGWLFGRPGPLPAARTVPHAVVPLLPDPSGVERATPFEIVSDGREPVPIEQRYLASLCHYLEEAVDRSGPAALLFLCFEGDSPLGRARRARLLDLAERSEFTIATGSGIGTLAGSDVRARFVEIPQGDPLGREWVTAVLGPHYAAALVARSLGGHPSDPYRHLEYVLTHDRSIVLRVARALMGRVGRGDGAPST